jgi:uncharacterized protein (DUF58 family)
MALADWLRTEQVSSNGRAEIGARRIYILPTRYGVMFATLLFLMLLGAVNYGNNPGHLLTFLLGALSANAIYLTWRNLRGLRLTCHGAAPVFAGETARYVVELDADGRERPAIQLAFGESEPILLDLRAEDANPLRELQLRAPRRGEHSPGRLTVSTQHPLGLFRAWCHVACEPPLLVYPKPGNSWLPPGTADDGADDGSSGAGNEDFAGLRGYQRGDQRSQIDWKSYARDRGLNTRLFSGQTTAPLWLEWKDAPGVDTEARLSSLARAVLDADGRSQPFGLKTPDGAISPAGGVPHRHQCLRHLALYGSHHA